MWVLTSAKGSPGVTTAALALAAAASTDAAGWDEVLLLELDPAGGDLECWCGPHGEAGLLAAVTDVRDPASAERLRTHAVDVVPGVKALLAPTTAPSVSAALRTASEGFSEAAAHLGGTTIVDLGRWVSPASTHASVLVRHALVVAVVCRSALASVEHARALTAELQTINRRVVILMVGRPSPYRPDEVAAAIGAPVVGLLPWDPRGVGALVVHGASRSWSRSPLSRSAAEVVEALARYGQPEWVTYG